MGRVSRATEEQIQAAVSAVVDSGLSQRDAAKRYGVPRGTIATRIRRMGDSGEPRKPAPKGPGRRPQPDSTRPADSNRFETGPDTIPAQRRELTVPDEALSDSRVDATRLRAAIVLAQGGTHAEAAEAAGVGRSTVSTWMQDPVMQTVVGDLRLQVNRALWEQGAAALLKGAVNGISALDRSRAFLDRVIAEGVRHMEVDLAELSPDEREVAIALREGGVKQALEAARALPTTVRPMMDAGGFPKTERIEHAGGVEVSAARSPEELDAEIAALDQQIAALESGTVLDVEAEEAP